MNNTVSQQQSTKQKVTLLIMHIIILLLSVFLITVISIDTFHNVKFYQQPQFDKWQFYICVFFMIDYFVELFMAPKKWHYIWTHMIFLIVAIPYQVLINHFGWNVSRELAYLIRYMPLIRGGYALAIVISWLTSNKATGLFLSYIVTLFSTVYFASLTFYLFEYKVNPLVLKYEDALWWATMDVTTVGSNIVAVTGVGRVLSVILAAVGMMMFPIFTVYVTTLITDNHNSGHYSETQLIKDLALSHKNETDKTVTKK